LSTTADRHMRTYVYTPADLSEVRPLPRGIVAAIRDQVERDLAALRAGEKVALVAGIDEDHGARLAILLRKGEHWSFSGYVAKPWNGPLDYGARIVVAF